MSATAGTPSTIICTICPFVGTTYSVRCPQCEVCCVHLASDGDALRLRPLWKYCERGHKFLVRLDKHAPASAGGDGAASAQGMARTKKKARLAQTPAEMLAAAGLVRERMGIMLPLDQRQAGAASAAPAPSAQPGPSTAARLAMEARSAAAARLAGAALDATAAADSGRWRTFDEDEDINAGLRTISEIAAEQASADTEPDSK